MKLNYLIMLNIYIYCGVIANYDEWFTYALVQTVMETTCMKETLLYFSALILLVLSLLLNSTSRYIYSVLVSKIISIQGVEWLIVVLINYCIVMSKLFWLLFTARKIST